MKNGAMLSDFLDPLKGEDWVIAVPQTADWGLAPADAWSSAVILTTSATAISVGNQGALAMKAPTAVTKYGVNGSGVTIGILSDSFNLKGAMAADIAAGVLPSNIDILEEGPSGGSDEGRAMAELVHQVAPGASIDFYSAYYSETDFAAGIKALAAAGCSIIVDDVSYFDEPFFQDGAPIDAAIESVVSQGVSYFTAAGNEGEDYYQNSFAAYSTTLPGLKGSYLAENFGTAGAPSAYETLTIPDGDKIVLDLQWDQPFATIGTGNASINSLGMVLYNASNQIVAKAMKKDVGGNPVQLLSFDNTTTATDYHLAIVTNGGTVLPGTFKFVLMSGDSTIDDPLAGIGSGSAYGHAMIAQANSVGAIAAANAPTRGGSGAVETYSSSGPGTMLFSATGARLAAPVSEGKVNFIAPDGIKTDVFHPFYGTSAAAPDAAAVAALMLQAKPGLSPGQVTSILTASAIPVTGGAGQVGAGLIQATTAVKLALKTVPATSALMAAANPFAGGDGGPAPNAVHTALASLGGDLGSAGFSVQIDPSFLAPSALDGAGGAASLSVDPSQPYIMAAGPPTGFA